MSIGSRIKEARLRKELTQEQLSAIIGVTKGAIANYENEVSVPKIDLMYKLFKALEVDANYLHQDEMKKPATGEGDGLDDKSKMLIQLYDSLDDSRREELLRHARLLELEQNQ